MIGSFQESFRPDDIKVPEAGERMEQRDQPSVPTLDDLKSKLEDIFKAETPDSVSRYFGNNSAGRKQSSISDT